MKSLSLYVLYVIQIIAGCLAIHSSHYNPVAISVVVGLVGLTGWMVYSIIRRRNNDAKKSNSGFTLIELMIVVAILGVLATVAVPQYLNFVKVQKAKENGTYVEKGEEASETIAREAKERGEIVATEMSKVNLDAAQSIISQHSLNDLGNIVTREYICNAMAEIVPTGAATSRLSDGASLTVIWKPEKCDFRTGWISDKREEW